MITEEKRRDSAERRAQRTVRRENADSRGQDRNSRIHRLQGVLGNQAVTELYERGSGPAGASKGRVDTGRSGSGDGSGGRTKPNAIESNAGIDGSRAYRGAESTSGETRVDTGIERSVRTLRGGGRPLSQETRSFFEPRFGHDFSEVRVHTGTKAHTLSRAISARAFTVGRDLFFRRGEHRPNDRDGRELLAHELTHVIQQGGGVSRPPMTVSSPADSAEREADRVAEQVIRQSQETRRTGGGDRDPAVPSASIEAATSTVSRSIFRYPSSRNGWSVRVTTPEDPPDIYVPQVSAGYDVDGDLSSPAGLLSAFQQGGWYLEGVYSSNGTSKKIGAVRSVVSEGDTVTARDLADTTDQGAGYLVLAAQLLSDEWIEDRKRFQAYQHGWIRHPRDSIHGPQRKVFLRDVVGPTSNPRGRNTNVDITQTFAQGWTASASKGASYAQATSTSHGFDASLGGEAGGDAAKASGSLGYQYSEQDTQTLTGTINNTMAISGTDSKSFKLSIEPGEVGALVPWGHTVALDIPSIKTDARGWVTDASGHLVMVGRKVQSAQPLVGPINEGESEAEARARLQRRINEFQP